MIEHVLGVLRNVRGVLCNDLGVLHNDLGVLRNDLGVSQYPGCVAKCPVCVAQCLGCGVHGVEGSWAAQEGPIELLLAKVKNASGRIGIFISIHLMLYI